MNKRPALHQLRGGAVGAEVLPQDFFPVALAVFLDGFKQGLQTGRGCELAWGWTKRRTHLQPRIGAANEWRPGVQSPDCAILETEKTTLLQITTLFDSSMLSSSFPCEMHLSSTSDRPSRLQFTNRIR